MSGIGTKLAIGAGWMALLRLSERGLGLISTIVLARLLVPEDFGLTAMAMSLIALLQLLDAFNFDIALIQNQKAERRHFDTAWTSNVLLGVISAVVIFLLAGPTAAFYGEPRLKAVVEVLASGQLIAAFRNIGVVAFRKDLDFNREFRFLVCRKLVSVAVTLTAAVLWRSYWALVAGMLVGVVLETALSYTFHPYRPRFSLAARHELFRFSGWIFLTNLFHTLRMRSSDFIIGRVIGSHALGVYVIAFEISNLATSELVAPINRVVFPGYAKLSDDLSKLRECFFDVIAIIALIALPAAVGIAVTAEPLVGLFLGPKWSETVPVIQVLALFGAATSLHTNLGAIYWALGRPRIPAILHFVYLVLLVPLLILFTARHGMIGAASASFATAVVMLIATYSIVIRLLEASWRGIVVAMWRPLVATGAMAVVVKQVLASVGPASHALQHSALLAIAVTVGVATYISVVLLLWHLSGRPVSAERHILDKVFAAIRPAAPGPSPS